ncbi:MAG: hypothetical protein ACRC5A_14740 [Enterobacteriaceae bacterium]
MLEYSVVSSMDRDDLYAELSCDGVQWGELTLSNDKKSFNLTIYPDTDNVLSFDSDAFTLLIQKAKSELLRIEGITL